MIFPDSTTILPDTSAILIDDPQAIFAEVPYKEEKTWGEYWKDWKDFGTTVTMGGVNVSGTVLNILDNITSRKEMETYLERINRKEAEKLPKDLYQSWLALNK
jgi:hypothetical protein